MSFEAAERSTPSRTVTVNSSSPSSPVVALTIRACSAHRIVQRLHGARHPVDDQELWLNDDAGWLENLHPGVIVTEPVVTESTAWPP